MANAGTLSVDLALQSAQFLSQLKRTSGQVEKTALDMSRSFAGIDKGIGIAKTAIAGFAAGFSIDFLAQAVQSAFDYGDAIVDLSDRTGVSTKLIQEFGFAAQLSGSSVDSARTGLEKFAKVVGSGGNASDEAIKKLRAMGITSADTGTALGQFADHVKGLETPQQRLAAVTELFGKKAGDLTQTLSQGSAGIGELSAQANNLGIVLEDDVLRNAGQLNDKLDTMRMILSAQMANTILQNADSFVSLADGIMRATGALADFIARGAIAGDMSVLNGGPIQHSVSKMLYGDGDKMEADARGRLARTSGGRSALYKANADEMNGIASSGRRGQRSQADIRRWQELKAENDRLLAGEVASRKGRSIAFRPGSSDRALGHAVSKPTKPKGPSAEELAKREAAREFAYQRSLSSVDSAILRARQDLSSSTEDRAQFDRDMLAIARREAEAQIDEEVKTGKLKADEAKALRARNAKLYGEATKDKNGDLIVSAPGLLAQRINQDEQEQIALEKLSVTNAQLDVEAEILQGSSALARTAAERTKLGLEIVRNTFEQRRSALEATVASQTATAAEKQIAQLQLDRLSALQGLAEKSVRQSSAGAGSQYLRAIPQTADDLKEQIEGKLTGALDSLNDGLAAAVAGTGSLKDAFSATAKSIISDIAKIGIQQAIVKPLAGALFGGDKGGGLLASLFGKRANGGLTRPGTYLVGERGPEIAQIGNSAQVQTFESLQRGAAKRAAGLTINFGSITSNDPDAIRRAANDAIRQAMPGITQAAMAHTMSRAGRPRL